MTWVTRKREKIPCSPKGKLGLIVPTIPLKPNTILSRHLSYPFFTTGELSVRPTREWIENRLYVPVVEI